MERTPNWRRPRFRVSFQLPQRQIRFGLRTRTRCLYRSDAAVYLDRRCPSCSTSVPLSFRWLGATRNLGRLKRITEKPNTMPISTRATRVSTPAMSRVRHSGSPTSGTLWIDVKRRKHQAAMSIPSPHMDPMTGVARTHPCQEARPPGQPSGGDCGIARVPRQSANTLLGMRNIANVRAASALRYRIKDTIN
jgi:hypothetical protein